MDLKIYTIAKQTETVTDKTIDFYQNYLCDFHLSAHERCFGKSTEAYVVCNKSTSTLFDREACRVQRLWPFLTKKIPQNWMQNGILRHLYKKIRAICCEFSFKVWLQILERFAYFKAKRAQNILKNKK
jgi:hypothetical protein